MVVVVFMVVNVAVGVAVADVGGVLYMLKVWLVVLVYHLPFAVVVVVMVVGVVVVIIMVVVVTCFGGGTWL